MATIFDIARLDVQDESGPIAYPGRTLTIDVEGPELLEVLEVEVPGEVRFIESLVVGPQGPPGDSIIHVGPTSPADPTTQYVWIEADI